MPAVCHKCGAPLTVTDSCFAGFRLLQCSDCERPIRLIVDGPRISGTRPIRRADRNRVMRAARRAQLRGQQ